MLQWNRPGLEVKSSSTSPRRICRSSSTENSALWIDIPRMTSAWGWLKDSGDRQRSYYAIWKTKHGTKCIQRPKLSKNQPRDARILSARYIQICIECIFAGTKIHKCFPCNTQGWSIFQSCRQFASKFKQTPPPREVMRRRNGNDGFR